MYVQTIYSQMLLQKKVIIFLKFPIFQYQIKGIAPAIILLRCIVRRNAYSTDCIEGFRHTYVCHRVDAVFKHHGGHGFLQLKKL